MRAAEVKESRQCQEGEHDQQPHNSVKEIDQGVVDGKGPNLLGELGGKLRPIPGGSVDVVLEPVDSCAAGNTDEHDNELQVLGGRRAEVSGKKAAEKALDGLGRALRLRKKPRGRGEKKP